MIANGKKPRSKNGCLTCRQRKTKCSEHHPQCVQCVKSSFECVWADLRLANGTRFVPRRIPKKIGLEFIHYGATRSREHGEKIGFKMARAALTDYSLLPLPRTPRQNGFSPLNGFSPQNQFSPFSSDGLLSSDEPLSSNKDLLRDKPLPINKALSSDQLLPSNKVLPSNKNLWTDSHLQTLPSQILSFQNLRPDTPASDTEEALDGDQQLTIGLNALTGIRSWIPGAHYGPHDPQLLHAFVTGFIPAISPQHCHPQLTPMAVFMHQGILEPMMRDVFYACGAAFMSNENDNMMAVARKRYAACLVKFANRLSATNGRIEEWMVAAALLFTLRDKFVGSSPEQPTTHLAKAIELIRILRRSAGDSSVTLKFFVDSFLFNYSVVLITGGPLAQKILPSPFKIFDEWRSVYEYRPFRCFAPWMNNPVFGAATKAFEVAAKASWLVHQTPLDNDNMVIACELLADTYRLELPSKFEVVVDNNDGLSRKDFLHVQQSLVVHDVGKLSCQILLLRLMNPSLDLAHPIVSEKVKLIVDGLRTLCADTTLWVICSWLLLITGLCCEAQHDRDYVVTNCYRASKLFRAAFMNKVGDFLQQAWGSEQAPGPGWDLLFDPAALQDVCL